MCETVYARIEQDPAVAWRATAGIEIPQASDPFLQLRDLLLEGLNFRQDVLAECPQCVAQRGQAHGVVGGRGEQVFERVQGFLGRRAGAGHALAQVVGRVFPRSL